MLLFHNESLLLDHVLPPQLCDVTQQSRHRDVSINSNSNNNNRLTIVMAARTG